MKFLEHIDVNPKITLQKGKVYPFIEMANVGINSREPVVIEKKAFNSGVKFQDGDSVFARIEPCLQNGKSFYCKDIGVGFGSTEFLVFRPKDDVIDSKFLYYFLKTDFIRKSMIGSMTGSTGRQRVNNDIFKSLEIAIPDIGTQRRIADMLFSYDDLIENNQKQIKLLEEAAQRLYKEWFVDLHFPGYDNFAIVNCFPNGWRKLSLFNIFTYIRGKSYTSAELSETEGKLLVNLKNIQAWGGYNREAKKRYIGPYNESQKLHFGDIIMAVTDMTQERRLVGHVALAPQFNEDAIISMDLIKIIPSADIPSFFLYSLLRFSGIAEKISVYANGTNVLHLKPESFLGLEVIIPTIGLMNKYNEIVKCYYQKIEALASAIVLLKQARDRLLPKLMNGELEV